MVMVMDKEISELLIAVYSHVVGIFMGLGVGVVYYYLSYSLVLGALGIAMGGVVGGSLFVLVYYDLERRDI